LADVESVLWQATGGELGPVLREIDDLGRLVEAARAGNAFRPRADLLVTRSGRSGGK